MKKDRQKLSNEICEAVYQEAMLVYSETLPCHRLRYCNASVYENSYYYYLKSYSTIVAIIDKEKDACVDVLRLVYGYTSTSAQHIAKFDRDYGQDKFGCCQRYTWYPV